MCSKSNTYQKNMKLDLFGRPCDALSLVKILDTTVAELFLSCDFI
jgi:hypothetical protein